MFTLDHCLTLAGDLQEAIRNMVISGHTREEAIQAVLHSAQVEPYFAEYEHRMDFVEYAATSPDGSPCPWVGDFCAFLWIGFRIQNINLHNRENYEYLKKIVPAGVEVDFFLLRGNGITILTFEQQARQLTHRLQNLGCIKKKVGRITDPGTLEVSCPDEWFPRVAELLKATGTKKRVVKMLAPIGSEFSPGVSASSESSETKSENCAICLENVGGKPFKIWCEEGKHEFHNKCIDEWALRGLKENRNPTCPACRRDLASWPSKWLVLHEIPVHRESNWDDFTFAGYHKIVEGLRRLKLIGRTAEQRYDDLAQSTPIVRRLGEGGKPAMMAAISHLEHERMGELENLLRDVGDFMIAPLLGKPGTEAFLS
ncbi:hypothetical protein [Streptomyces sp. NPDC047981]|uniref:RING-H2 finger protein n=1 Tax=Streptomyces sp. NPDC047981 TaxID=3154610 RepID=UPI00343CB09D